MPLYRIGKTWYIDISSKRGRIRESTKFTEKDDALKYLEKREQEIKYEDQLGILPEVTWGRAVEKWISVKSPGEPDQLRLTRLKDLSTKPLPLSATEIEPHTKGLSNGSWNRLLTVISIVHKVSGVTPPPLERRKTPPGRTRWLSKKEWAKLQESLKKYSPLLEQAARFTLATGLRENNVLNLEWSQVNLKRRTALLSADQVKNRETLGVPLNNAAMAVLRERRGLDKVWVFAHPDSGKPLYKASMTAWYDAVEEAGMEGFRWHDLRHTWASWAVMNGVSLRELMELGGWKTFSMVTRYSHLAKDHLKEAASKVKPV